MPVPQCPQPDYAGAWARLRGYVAEAQVAGGLIDAATLLRYMDELRHGALASVRDWMGEQRRDGGQS